ncbi:hypothetical protein CMZ84_14170 [Lysobacteraceae bacterium NML93-0399]|nr:hypothetical protein CMZ84_14170 [Xanthomonadaceae bacterium NML93-0399]PBS12383.1 hypothetical protein CMZ82_09485 [Xanthomonadaceae bacterium NML93-0792]PBS15931.1 hypothetical protein CMZ81_08305 [Xanthomonadaceae bacterium NML93-0793]PBS18887.1 hypothetical protein CMZ80_09290 [Xanthomonadaceae bacterium NML93-0831]
MMPISTPPADRTFFDLPTDEKSNIETAEFLANFRYGSRTGWSALLESERVLIVSEAGMGKTYECQRQQKRLWDDGRPSFFLELAVLATDPLERQFSVEEQSRFDAWKAAQTERAFFFLDSVDELRLTQRSFDATLKRFASALGAALDRACIVLTSRPTVLDLEIVRSRLPVTRPEEMFVPEEYFANVAMSVEKTPVAQVIPEWRFVALSGLDEQQMRALAAAEGVDDPEALLAAINAHHAHDFAKRPLDFLELCGDWKIHGRIRSHRDQVDNSIGIKLRPRGDRQERTQLSPQRAREGAARLALAALLSRKLTLWHSSDNDRGRGDATLEPAKVLIDWANDEVQTLLERPLFGFATYGRVRFHNRSIIEFLAAERLQQLMERGLPIRALMRLLFATTPEGQRIVKPSLQPVSAWLALQVSIVFSEVLARDPSLPLRYGDPGSLSPAQRTQALERYVETYGADGWRGQRIPSLQLQRLATTDLDAAVERLWKRGITNPEVRETLLELMAAGRMVRCSDIAHGVVTDPVNDVRDRLHGLLVLAELDDPRLPALLDAVVSPAPEWPEQLARLVIQYLLPQHLSVPQLVQALARLTTKSRDIGGVSTMLPLVIAKMDLDPTGWLELQQGLAALVSGASHWDERHFRVSSDRQDLVPALLVACRRRLEMGRAAADLFDAIALAGLLARHDHDAGGDSKTLKAALGEASSDVRAGVFWATDHLVRTHHPKGEREPFFRLFQFGSHGAYQLDLKRDADWVLRALSDPARSSLDREVALEIALQYSGSQPDRTDWARQLIELSSSSSVLHDRAKAFLDSIENPPPPPAWQREDQRRSEKARRKQASNLASWRLFWRELDNDPETAFSVDKIDNTTWHLWHAMAKDSSDQSFAGWNRGFIERVFDKAMADRFRTALAAAWRKDRPTLKSERPPEERNSYLMRWRMGLAGLYAEAEDASWAVRLTAEEADLACRYALIDLSRLPPWLDAVIQVHPTVVDAAIGNELSAELEDTDEKHASLLQEISNTSTPIVSFFLPRIRTWLKAVLADQDTAVAGMDKVGRAITLLLEHGLAEDAADVLDVGRMRLQGTPDPSETKFWLPILARLDPAECVDTMERLAGAIPPAKHSVVVDWIAALFGNNGSEADLSRFETQPDLLLRLARMANRHVRFVDDLNHEGVHSMGTRDYAERGRSVLGNRLLGAKGAGAWEMKMQFANDPDVVHFQDRIRAVALEQLAEDWDTVILDETDVVRLEAEHDFSPTSRVEMAALLNARLCDLDDLLVGDTSPRELWAIITQERVLRKSLAGELKNLARGAYLVNQEAVTGDEKETDIRLASTKEPLEAVIELKIGENGYSFTDLQQALHTQLAGKYMAPEHRRVGCLLISISGDRHWLDPVTKTRMEFEEVVSRLDIEAKELAANLGYGAHLVAKGLDLRPRKAT